MRLRPSPRRPCTPYGDTLADSDGYLYDTNGAAVIIDGRHATIKAVEAEADHWATHEFRRRQQVAPAQNGLRGPASASPEMTSALPTTSGSQEGDYLEGFQEPIGSVSVGTSRVL